MVIPVFRFFLPDKKKFSGRGSGADSLCLATPWRPHPNRCQNRLRLPLTAARTAIIQ